MSYIEESQAAALRHRILVAETEVARLQGILRDIDRWVSESDSLDDASAHVVHLVDKALGPRPTSDPPKEPK